MSKPLNKIIKRASIIVLIVFLMILLGAVGMGGWLYYLYLHPESLKPRLEKYISHLAGISFRIDVLNYSLDPIAVRFRGISINKPDELELKIDHLNIEMERTVLAGRKKLIIKEVELNNFSGNISKIPSLPGISLEQKESSSFFSILLNKIKEAYLFQDLEFRRFKARDGLIDIHSGRTSVSISRITAEIGPDHYLETTFSLRVDYEKDTTLDVPEARVSADVSRLNQADRMDIGFSALDLGFHSPYAAAGNISLQASFEYGHQQKLISLASFSLLFPKILINPGTREEAFTPPLEIKAGGRIDLGRKTIADTHVGLTFGSLMVMEAALKGHFGENPDLIMDILQSRISPQKFRPFIPLEIRDTLDPFHLDGNIFLTGEMGFSDKVKPWPLAVRIKADLENNRLAYRHKDINAEGIVNGILYLNGSWPDFEIRAGINTTGAGIASPFLKIDAEKLDLELEGKHPFYNINALSGKITNLIVPTSRKDYLIENIRFESKDGEIDLADSRFHFPALELSAPAIKNLSLDFTLDRKKDSPAGFQDPGSWKIDFKGAFSEIDLSHLNDSISMQAEGFLSGDVQFQGQWPRFNAMAGLKSRDARIHGSWGSFNPRDLKLKLEINHPQYQIRDLKGLIVQARARLGEREFPVNDISAGLPYGRIDFREKSIDVPELILTTPPLGNARLSLKGGQNDFELKLKSEDSSLLKSALTWNFLPQDWQMDAGEAFDLKASFKENLDCAFSLLFNLDNLALSNNDSTVMGEDISIRTSLAGDLDITNRKLEVELDLQGQNGELLLDKFYLNFNPNPINLNSLIKADILNELVDVSRLNLNLKEIISLSLNGRTGKIFSDPDFQFSLLIPKSPVEPVFRHFIQEPFQPGKDVLKDLEIDGYVSADLDLKGNKGVNGLKGKITFHDVDLNLAGNSLNLEGVNLELPLWYERQALEGSEPAITGSLSIDSISSSWIPEQSLSLALEVNQNQILVQAPTEIIIPGGIARIGPVQGRDIFSHPMVETSLTLENIELGPWLDKFLPLDIQGTLNGRLSPVRFTGNQVKGEGKLTAQIANGKIILSNLHISRLNTPTPVFGLDGSFHRLDLAELTTETPFGRIQGLLEGYINNLEITYGQPQNFELLLETVREKGIPQRISVEAVENIARLGGGQSPFMGLAGMYITFLKDFPYQKIGIRSSLKNDVFRINGTIREEGQEYIIKRGLYGVNIINRDPNNKIRFKEMVNRIKTLDFSKTKPVIQ